MFQIDRFGRTPIYEQVIEQAEKHILAGVLCSGDQLPSVRTLSQSVSVNPNTLQKAYAELERRGLCRAAPGSGRYITEDARSLLLSAKKEQIGKLYDISAELLLAGVPLEDALQTVRDAYEGETRI